VRANVTSRSGEVANNTSSRQRGGGILRRICNLKQFGSWPDGVAWDVCVVQKDRRAEDYDGVMTRELIGKRFLRGQQSSAVEAMRSRKSPARRNRLLIDVSVEVLGKRDDLVPAVVFFNLRAYDEGGVVAGIERANYFIEGSGVCLNDLRNFAHVQALAFVSPVIHGNGDEDRPHGRLNRKIVAACNGCRHVLRTKRFVGPFHIGFDRFYRATYEERFGQDLAAILLSGGYDERSVAIEGVDQCGEAVAYARHGMHVNERSAARGHRVSQAHAYRGALVQTEDVLKIGRHVAEKRQFGRAGIAENQIHAQVAQNLIRDFSYRAQRKAPDSDNCMTRAAKLYHLARVCMLNSLGVCHLEPARTRGPLKSPIIARGLIGDFFVYCWCAESPG
jgi:hypothetical protein